MINVRYAQLDRKEAARRLLEVLDILLALPIDDEVTTDGDEGGGVPALAPK